MADPKETGIPPTREAQMAQLERFFRPEVGGRLAESDLVGIRTKSFGDGAREAATPHGDPAPSVKASAELTPEFLAECLKNMEADYRRGIVVVGEEGTANDFKAALKQDKTAGISWKQVRTRLLAGDNALLKKAARMQGGGELIGVDTSGKLVIITRADEQGNREPEIFGFRADQVEGVGDQRKPKSGEKPILINTDTRDSEALMAEIGKSGLFADYWEIRDAVHGEGFTLPPDSPNYEKKGLVAAVEAVTGQDFVRSANGNELRSAILECGDVSPSSDVRVVVFSKVCGGAHVVYIGPGRRDDFRGAVRVLRG